MLKRILLLRYVVLVGAALVAGALGDVPAAQGQEAGHKYALLVGGLGGSPEYTDAFQQYLFETRRALVERFGFSEDHVTVLAETSLRDLDFVDDVSTAENVRAWFADVAGRATADDHVYVLLYGHGSFDGERAWLNLPRRDLSDADYAALLDTVPAGRIVFINTASASGPFIEALAAPERIVVTATRTGTQRNETAFPRYLVEALSSPAADLDKDGTLSVQELFRYAAEQTARSFSEAGYLATEHALLEDTGDGQAHQVEELAAAGEGNLAAVTYLARGGAAVAATGGTPAVSGPVLREREEVERAIAALKAQKNQLDEDAYYAELETLFVRLARLNDRIEAETGGR